jgi:hypothetical protein
VAYLLPGPDMSRPCPDGRVPVSGRSARLRCSPSPMNGPRVPAHAGREVVAARTDWLRGLPPTSPVTCPPTSARAHQPPGDLQAHLSPGSAFGWTLGTRRCTSPLYPITLLHTPASSWARRCLQMAAKPCSSLPSCSNGGVADLPQIACCPPGSGPSSMARRASCRSGRAGASPPPRPATRSRPRSAPRGGGAPRPP